MQSVYDLLRKLVDDHGWRNEADKVQAHGVINQADPNYEPPVASNHYDAQQSFTPEQQTIAALQAELARLRGSQAHTPNADQMRQYAYPVSPQQPQQQQQIPLTPEQYAAQYQAQHMPPPQSPPGQPLAQQMRGYQYPGTEAINPGPATGYNPVTPFQ